MSEELRRKDDLRYHEMRETIEALKETQETVMEKLALMMADIKENHSLFYDPEGIFATLHQHTLQIEESHKKLDGLALKVAGLHEKLDKMPKSFKIEKLPKLIGMAVGGFVAGMGAVIWAVVEIVRYIKP